MGRREAKRMQGWLSAEEGHARTHAFLSRCVVFAAVPPTVNLCVWGQTQQGPHRLVVRTSRRGRDNPGSTPGVVMLCNTKPSHCKAGQLGPRPLPLRARVWEVQEPTRKFSSNVLCQCSPGSCSPPPRPKSPLLTSPTFFELLNFFKKSILQTF